MQIYDIDGDGFDEVITAKNFEVLILDGRTGEVKKRAKTPFSTPEEDGTIIAGYAVWRELIAELIAFELDDNCDVVPLRRKKDLLSYYEGYLLTVNGKLGVSLILC